MNESAFSRSIEKLSLAKALQKIYESSAGSLVTKVHNVALEESVLLTLEQVMLMFGWEVIELSGLSNKMKKPQSALFSDLNQMNDFLESNGCSNQLLVLLLSYQSDSSHWLSSFYDKLELVKSPAQYLIERSPTKSADSHNLIPLNQEYGEYSVFEFVDLMGSMLSGMRTQMAEF